MSELGQLECYVPAPGPIVDLVRRFTEALTDLTDDAFAVEQWIADFPHDTVGTRFAWPKTRTRFRLKRGELAVEPMICGWPPSGLAEIWTPKLELDLVFESDEAWDDEEGTWRPVQGGALYETALELCRRFDATVFMTTEDSEGEAFQSVASGHPKWAFELGCFPPGRVRQWPRRPFDYELDTIDGIDVSYRRACWAAPPWELAEP